MCLKKENSVSKLSKKYTYKPVYIKIPDEYNILSLMINALKM